MPNLTFRSDVPSAGADRRPWQPASRTRIGESRKSGDRRLVVISLIVADVRAGMLTIRIAYYLDGQEVPPTPA
jgi:hypothetical protein